MGFITVDQHNSTPVELYYTDEGHGQPVILIHGYPLDGTSWEHQSAALLDAGYRVITYDRRGFGRSTATPTGYNYTTFASDLNTVLTTLELTDTVLVGFSMGSGEVTRYLARYGEERVAHAVLIGCLQPYLLNTEDNPDGAVDMAFIEDFSTSVRRDRFAHMTGFLKNFFNTDQTMPERLSPEALAHHHHVANAASAHGAVHAPFSWVEDFRNDLEVINGYTVPVTVIHGTADQILPFTATAQRVPQWVQRATITDITDAPHGLLWTHRHEVNSALLNALGN